MSYFSLIHFLRKKLRRGTYSWQWSDQVPVGHLHDVGEGFCATAALFRCKKSKISDRSCIHSYILLFTFNLSFCQKNNGASSR